MNAPAAIVIRPRRWPWFSALALLALAAVLLLGLVLTALPWLEPNAAISIDDHGIVLQHGSFGSLLLGMLIAGLVLTALLAVLPLVLIGVLLFVVLVVLLSVGAPLAALLGLLALLLSPLLLLVAGVVLLLRRVLRGPRPA